MTNFDGAPKAFCQPSEERAASPSVFQGARNGRARDEGDNYSGNKQAQPKSLIHGALRGPFRLSRRLRQGRIPWIVAEAAREKKRGALMHRAQHAVPASPGGQVNQTVDNAADSAGKRVVAVFLFRAENRPINYYRPAHDGFPVDKAPIAAIPTVVAIVAHGKVIAGGNQDLTIMSVAENLGGPFGLHIGEQLVVIGGREIVEKRIVSRRGIVVRVGFSQFLAVNVNLLVDNLDAVARHPDHAFHIVRVVLERE